MPLTHPLNHSLPAQAFKDCVGLTTLIIPPSTVRIEGAAFEGCCRLTGPLTLPPALTVIGSAAFAGCTGLHSLKFDCMWVAHGACAGHRVRCMGWVCRTGAGYPISGTGRECNEGGGDHQQHAMSSMVHQRGWGGRGWAGRANVIEVPYRCVVCTNAQARAGWRWQRRRARARVCVCWHETQTVS